MILITGATGFIGRHLIRALLKHGEKLVCFVKATENGGFLKKWGAHVVYGDVTSKNSVEQAFEFFPKIKEVIHLAALIKSTESKEQYQQNVVGTKNVVEAAVKHKVKKFIFTSTDFILYPASNPYRDSKLAAEKILKRSELNYTILRPTPVYGKGDDKNFISVFNLVKKYPAIPAIECIMQPVHVDDVVKAIISVLRNPKTFRKEYNLPGGSVVSFAQILKIISKQMGKHRLIMTVPNKPLLACILAYELVSFHPIVRYYQVKKWTLNKVLSTEDNRHDFEYAPISFEEGMVRTIAASASARR